MQSRCGFQIVNFPKNNKTKVLKRNKNIFLIFWALQGLTLVLRILIQNEKSWLRSSFKKTLCLKMLIFLYFENFIFFGIFELL